MLAGDWNLDLRMSVQKSYLCTWPGAAVYRKAMSKASPWLASGNLGF
jgi:hypothetical protein